MQMKILSVVLMVLSALSEQGFCAGNPPPQTSDEITVAATLKSDPVKFISLGNFVVWFETSSLDQIRDHIGCGSIEHAGDAGGSQYWLCYSRPGQIIWFISHGEMGGPEHRLTQVIAVAAHTVSMNGDNVPAIPTHALPITSSFGWIGTSRDDLIKAVGEPSGIRENKMIFFYSGIKPASADVDMVGSITAYIEAETAGDKVISIYASHVSSY